MRYLISGLLFIGLGLAASIRIVASVCVGAISQEFDLSNNEIGSILSSFFIGYLCLQGFAGWGATRYGGHWLLGVGILVCSIFTLLTPLGAGSYGALFALRFGAGLAQGLVYPSVHALFGRWAPAKERSILVTCVWGGSLLGTCLSLPIASSIVGGAAAPPLEGSSSDIGAHPAVTTIGGGGVFVGWRGAFYLFALLGIVWSMLWLALSSSDPESHPYITEAERSLIVRTRGGGEHAEGGEGEGRGQREGGDSADATPPSSPSSSSPTSSTELGSSSSQSPLPHQTKASALAAPPFSTDGSSSSSPSAAATAIPWLGILRQPAVWALFAGHTAHNFLYYTLLTWMPEYMRQQLNLDWEGIGLLASIPYAFSFCTSIAAGFIADHYIAALPTGPRRGLVRKAAQTAGEVIPALAIISLGYVTSTTASIALLILAQGFSGISHAGFASNHIDLSPKYSGLIFGLSNSLSTLSGICAPAIVGALVADHEGSESANWRLVFWIVGLFTLAGWLIFVLFAQGEPISLSSFGAGGEDSAARSRIMSLSERKQRHDPLGIAAVSTANSREVDGGAGLLLSERKGVAAAASSSFSAGAALPVSSLTPESDGIREKQQPITPPSSASSFSSPSMTVRRLGTASSFNL